MKKITEENFNELVSSNLPYIIEFGATWCGPCRSLAPRLEELSTELEGKVIVATVDTEESGDLATKFRVRNIPTILFFKAGTDQPCDKTTGLVEKSLILEKINAIL